MTESDKVTALASRSMSRPVNVPRHRAVLVSRDTMMPGQSSPALGSGWARAKAVTPRSFRNCCYTPTTAMSVSRPRKSSRLRV